MPLTEEELKKITADVAAQVVGSDAMGKLVGDSIRKIVPGIVESSTKPVTEGVAALTAQMMELGKKFETLPAPAPAPAVDPKTGQPAPTPAPAQDPEMLKLRAQLTEQQEAMKRLADERKADLERAKSDRMRANFLANAKVGEQPIKGAQMIWAQYGSQFEEDDAGNLRIKVKRKSGGIEYDETIGVSEWVPEYLQTDEGKMFAPAKNAGGSGGAQGNGMPRAGEKLTREQLVAMAVTGSGA